MIFSVCWFWFPTRLQVPWLQGLCVSFASVPSTGRLCITLNSIGYQVGLSILPVELITIVMAPLRAFLDTLLHINKTELHSAAVWNAHCGTWKAHCPTELNFSQKQVPSGFENPQQNLKLFSTSLYRSPSFFVYIEYEDYLHCQVCSFRCCSLPLVTWVATPKHVLLHGGHIIFSRTSWKQAYCQARVHWVSLHFHL